MLRKDPDPRYIQTHLEVCNTKLRSGGAVELLLNWRAITGLGGRAIADLKGFLAQYYKVRQELLLT